MTSSTPPELRAALPAWRGLTVVRGDGSRLYDADGRAYIDLMTNYGVNLLGHGHPLVTHAIVEQARLLTSAHQSFGNPVRDAFLAALRSLLPPQLTHVWFTNSGSEAIEVAIKLARAATGRTRLLAMHGAYHGRTCGALTLTAEPTYRDPFLPLLPDVTHVAYDDPAAVEAALDETVAAVFLEPIQGEAGVRVPDDGYLPALQAACQRVGALLVIDEVQTAFRTGAVLASSRTGVVGDIVCLGKGLANGLPIGLTVTSTSVAERMPRSGHGSTFAGNPLVCAAGAATLQVLADDAVMSRVVELGERATMRLRALTTPAGSSVRGRGLMLAVELPRPAASAIRRLQELRVLVLPAGRYVIRLLPSLVTDPTTLDRALDVMCEVLGAGQT